MATFFVMTKRKIPTTRQIHGMTGTRVHNAWVFIMSKCYNKNNKYYSTHGGVGVKVAIEWHSFEQFYKDMGPLEDRMVLERIDRTGDFSKDNCLYMSKEKQGVVAKTFEIKRFEYNNVWWTLAELAKMSGVSRPLLRWRLCVAQWPIEKAIINEDMRRLTCVNAVVE